MYQQLKRASMALTLSSVCFLAFAQKTIQGTVKDAPDFDKMCTYKITYPNFQAFSKNNLCKWVTQRLFFVSLHHVCT